jgi:ribonucleoside-diphosphate reductase alpha chain
VIEELTRAIVSSLSRRAGQARALHIEDIQDQVELALMRAGEHKVARAYILYRSERTEERKRREAESASTAVQSRLKITLPDGRQEPLDEARLEREMEQACAGLSGVGPAAVMAEVRRNVYDGIQLKEIGLAKVMAARTGPSFTSSASMRRDRLR